MQSSLLLILGLALIFIVLFIGPNLLVAYLRNNINFIKYINNFSLIQYYCQSGLCIVEYINGSITWIAINKTNPTNPGVGVIIPRGTNYTGIKAYFCVYKAEPALGIPLSPITNNYNDHKSKGLALIPGYSIQLNAWLKAMNGSWYWVQDVLLITSYNNENVVEPLWCVLKFNGTITCNEVSVRQELRYPMCGTLTIIYLPSNETLTLYFNNTEISTIKVYMKRFGLADVTLVGISNYQGVQFDYLNATLSLWLLKGNSWAAPSNLQWMHAGYWTGEYINGVSTVIKSYNMVFIITNSTK
ncbi:hypothetical protein [Vulcanisaeta distributa]|uniref:Uncharacterized protein n=1 Tax=Vulcanisaeta distributa (strain DSM 14429 / JCM 11212 / NBRC 100878 / IC-017) TaxID=572478 RepID=E1QPF5_VULDI|nr:hypothetical protein [Vulcanisaeta distributa]ADN51443.1 hypothetical protein Vdis_2073 [Vulcanisaeta distributa DSM 14429]